MTYMNIYSKLINNGIYKKSIIKSKNGSYFVKDFGNLGTKLTFVITNENIDDFKYVGVFKNYPCYDCDSISVMYGKFFTDSLNGDLFYPLNEKEATHVVLKCYYGRYFLNTKGIYLEETIQDNYVYKKRVINNYNEKEGIIVYVLEKRIYDLFKGWCISPFLFFFTNNSI